MLEFRNYIKAFIEDIDSYKVKTVKRNNLQDIMADVRFTADLKLKAFAPPLPALKITVTKEDQSEDVSSFLGKRMSHRESNNDETRAAALKRVKVEPGLIKAEKSKVKKDNKSN
jgi:hypothetical protein